MSRRSLGRQKAGAPIKADWLNSIADAAAAGASLSTAGGLRTIATPGGSIIAPNDAQPVLARITGGGTGAKYSWREVYAGNSPGSFPDGFLFGTLTVAYAIEQNGNANVPNNTRVTLYPIGGGRYRFQVGQCTGGGSSSPAVQPLLNQTTGTAPPGPQPGQTVAQPAAHVASLPPVPGGVL